MVGKGVHSPAQRVSIQEPQTVYTSRNILHSISARRTLEQNVWLQHSVLGFLSWSKNSVHRSRLPGVWVPFWCLSWVWTSGEFQRFVALDMRRVMKTGVVLFWPFWVLCIHLLASIEPSFMRGMSGRNGRVWDLWFAHAVHEVVACLDTGKWTVIPEIVNFNLNGRWPLAITLCPRLQGICHKWTLLGISSFFFVSEKEGAV